MSFLKWIWREFCLNKRIYRCIKLNSKKYVEIHSSQAVKATGKNKKSKVYETTILKRKEYDVFASINIIQENMIIDSHAHYDDDAYNEDRDKLLESMPNKGIGVIVNIGANIDRSRTSIALSEEYPHVYATVGVHPDDIAELDDGKMEELRELAMHDKVVAIGEFGLDYSREYCDQEAQKKWFIAQLQLAKECNLPIVVHSRDASNDTLTILKGKEGAGQRGIIHCYSYSVEIAREFIKLGYYFGIGGVATFKNAKKLKEAIAEIPLERIVLETDCPYLAPTPYRGTRNDSGYLSLIAEEIAQIKKVSVETVIEVTTNNSKQIYGLQV